MTSYTDVYGEEYDALLVEKLLYGLQYCGFGYYYANEACIQISNENDLVLQYSISNYLVNDDDMFEEYGFDLSDVERKCEVFRYTDNYGDVECRGSEYREVERKCDAYFLDSDSEYGEIDCRGSDFRVLEKNCHVYMYNESYGDIDC